MNLPYVMCAGNVIGDRRMGRYTCLRNTTIRKPFQGSGHSRMLLPNLKFVPTVHSEDSKSHSVRIESLVTEIERQYGHKFRISEKKKTY